MVKRSEQRDGPSENENAPEQGGGECMSVSRRALLLVGSPKAARSTSHSLGTYLLERLNERGFETEERFLQRSMRSDEGKNQLLLAMDRSDLVILASPLYVDSLPSWVIRTMELVNQHRKTNEEQKKQRLLAIVNCGFPEAHHNDTALAIVRKFASKSGFEWVGGLALGMGEAIAGRSLEKAGGMARNIRKSLDVTAESLGEGTAVPKKAVDLMARPFIPNWMYVWFGNRGWKKKAREHGVKDLNRRPYRLNDSDGK